MGEHVGSRIAGIWYNQLASQLRIEADAFGRLSGRYVSGVGDTTNEHPLTGFYDADPENGLSVLGFVVSWPSAHWLTVWSGLYEVDRDEIDSTWLLRSEAGGRDEWRSTLIGHDFFRRTAHTGETPGGTSASDVPVEVPGPTAEGR